MRKAAFLITLMWMFGCIAAGLGVMSTVMGLGGMVASGGPYVVAHPAPDSVVLLPLGIVTGLLAFFANMSVAPDEGPNLTSLAWPALFLGGAWNFFAFGFATPGGGVSWSWLVCGVMFAVMGGVPLPIAIGAAWGGSAPGAARAWVEQGLAVVLGAVGGFGLWRLVTG